MQVLGHARAMDERHKAWVEGMERERAKIAGVKPIRLPRLVGTGSATLVMGGDNRPLHSPQEGFVWAVREIAVEGMSTGANPDVINIWRGGTAAQTRLRQDKMVSNMCAVMLTSGWSRRPTRNLTRGRQDGSGLGGRPSRAHRA